jgi:hypothetical protein
MGVPMAIAVLIDCRGVTLEQYDEAIERGGFLPGEPLPPEGLFHWVTKTDDGILVVNVWKSREGYEQFEDRVAVLMQEVGVLEPPEIRIFEVHNYLAGGRRNY